MLFQSEYGGLLVSYYQNEDVWRTILTSDGCGSRHEPSFSRTREATGLVIVLEAVILFIIECDGSRSGESIYHQPSPLF